jgi:hypothetical protein
VVGRAIAFVPVEAVGRKAGAEFLHQAVPGYLGDDRGSRDRQHRLVPPGDGILREGQIDEAQMVDQQEARFPAQFSQGPAHRQASCREHSNPIELPGGTLANPDRKGNPLDLGSPALAGERRELLRVTHTLQGRRQVEPIKGQDHSSRHDRPGQGSPSDLIEARDQSMAEPAQLEFDHQIRPMG